MSVSDHRVYKIDDQLREAVKQDRLAKGQTVLDHATACVAEQLPGIVEGLLALGLSARGDTRPIRLPVTEPMLASLKAASERTGLPATALLLACFARATEAPVAPEKPKTRRPAKKAQASQRKSSDGKPHATTRSRKTRKGVAK